MRKLFTSIPIVAILLYNVNNKKILGSAVLQGHIAYKKLMSLYLLLYEIKEAFHCIKTFNHIFQRVINYFPSMIEIRDTS